MNRWIVIPVWVPEGNEIMMLGALTSLDSFRAHSKSRLMIVDNGANEDRAELRDRSDCYIRLEENDGFSGGVNAGLAELPSDADMIGVGSCDVVLTSYEESIDRMVRRLKVCEGIVSPYAEIWRFGINTTQWEQRNCDFWGGLWFMQRHVWEDLGPLDTEHFRLRFSDTDYGVRAAKAGWYVGRAGYVQHHNPSTSTLLMNDYELHEEYRALFEVHGEFVPNEWKMEEWFV